MSLQRFMDGVFEGIWDTKDFKTDKFIAWDIGSEIVINRNFFPDDIRIYTEYKTVQMVYSYKTGVCIEWNGNYFFANMIKKYIEEGFQNKPVEIRFFRAGLVYMEFKIDETYSFVVQQIMDYDGKGDLKPIPFDKVFKNVTISSDMEL